MASTSCCTASTASAACSPAWGCRPFAYGVFLGEVVGPLLVIVGLYTRLGALLMLGNMVVALALAHRAELFDIGPMGGWAIELQGLFLFGALAILLLGAGRYSVGGLNGRYN